MNYLGSKARLAKHIVPILQQAIDESGASEYIELFVGGANVIDKIKAEQKYGIDFNKWLITLLVAAKNQTPEYLQIMQEFYSLEDKDCRTEYNRLKSIWKTNSNDEMLKVAFYGFHGSFNGKFYDGGFAKFDVKHNRNTKFEKIRNLEKQVPMLQDIKFACKSFFDVDINYFSNCVIYLDPPYMGTTGYAISPDFNFELFWERVKYLAKNNKVFVSEESTLLDENEYDIVWQGEVLRSVNSSGKHNKSEKLYFIKG